MSDDVLGYSSHDWRKHTDDAIVVASDIGIQLEVNKSKVIFTHPKTLKKEEVDVSKALEVTSEIITKVKE